MEMLKRWLDVSDRCQFPVGIQIQMISHFPFKFVSCFIEYLLEFLSYL